MDADHQFWFQNFASGIIRRPKETRMTKIVSGVLTSMILGCLTMPAHSLPFMSLQTKAKFVGMTKIVHPGDPCSVTVQAEPGSLCEITVKKPNGSASRHPNLSEKRADAAGTVNWSWQMVDDAQPGDRVVIVKIIGRDNREIQIEKKMKVIK